MVGRTGAGRIALPDAAAVIPRAMRFAVLGLVTALLTIWLVAAVDVVWRAGDIPPLERLAPWSTPDGLQVLDGWGVPVRSWVALIVLVASVPAVAGAVAAWFVLRGPLTWFRCYVAVTLMLFVTAGSPVTDLASALHPGIADPAALLQGIGWVAMFQLAYVFPDGRFVPAWSRWLVLVWVGFLAASLMLAVALPDSARQQDLIDSVVVLVLVSSGVAAQVYRYRRVSGPVERHQTKGVLAALGLWLVFAAILVLTPLRDLQNEATQAGLVINLLILAVSTVILGLIPVSVAVAVLRYRLFDVDVWISRGLVYGMLVLFVVGVYVVVVGGLGLVWRDGGILLPVVATGLAAVVFTPVRLRLQQRIHRWVYGARDDPHAVLTRLGERLSSTLPSEQVAQTVVETIGSALRLPYVTLDLADGGPVTEFGRAPGTEERSFDVTYQGRHVGRLGVAPRPREQLSARDLHLLEEVAQQSGPALWAASLTADLRHSRHRAISIREEERRRLHRDLHDGLGPTLASLCQRLGATRHLITDDPARAATVLSDLEAQTRAAIADLRTLVYSLRPPALDELGLVGALQEACRRLSDRPDVLRITVRSDTEHLDLPADVEVAAYAIVMEAITNMLRHSSARSCEVSLGLPGPDSGQAERHLVVQISDDGVGLPEPDREQGGLATMRERAEEVGGLLTYRPGRPTGLVVEAALPIDPAGPTSAGSHP